MSHGTSAPVAVFKTVANAVALILVLPCAVTCWVEQMLSQRAEAVFSLWTHVFAVLPGHPGMYLRRAFYRLTLKRSTLDCFIGFGALIFHRQTLVEDGVYIGPYTVVGMAALRTGCLVGTRANLLSGAEQHEPRADGGWSPSDITKFRQIEVGAHAWIGEAATVMADVGPGSIVAAGSVVSAAVPPAIVVAGNPARFVRPAPQHAASASASS